jgi:hypothetical protein
MYVIVPTPNNSIFSKKEGNAASRRVAGRRVVCVTGGAFHIFRLDHRPVRYLLVSVDNSIPPAAAKPNFGAESRSRPASLARQKLDRPNAPVA